MKVRTQYSIYIVDGLQHRLKSLAILLIPSHRRYITKATDTP